MEISNATHRLAARTFAAMVIASIAFAMFPSFTIAQTRDAILKLRPHCTEEDQTKCAAYAVLDPVTLRTPDLAVGSLLDMDLVLENPGRKPVSRVRGWMSYDPAILEGTKVEAGKAFPVIAPGEADFAALQGFIQIGLSTVNNASVSDAVIPVARIQMNVKKSPAGGKTVLAFYDAKKAADGHTAAVSKEDGVETNILSDTLGSLLVQVKPSSESPSSASSVSSALSSAEGSASVSSVSPALSSVEGSESSDSSVSSSVTPTASTASNAISSSPARTSFVLLQVQNLRVTTEGSTVYLAWDPLASGELQGYNLYYGAQTGRYIQRRSLPATTSTLTIRALPLGTTYYFAVRGVNKANEESAFSKEVAVKVGDPKSSTNPLVGGAKNTGPQGKNPIKGKPTKTVPGKTGTSSSIALLLVVSAIIGTLFAFRRQMTATSHS